MPEPGNPGNHVLHVVSPGPSDYMTLHNHIETTFANGAGVTNGHNYQVSFRAKWLAGPNQLNTRLYFGRCQKTVLLPCLPRVALPVSPIRRTPPTLSDLRRFPPCSFGAVRQRFRQRLRCGERPARRCFLHVMVAA